MAWERRTVFWHAAPFLAAYGMLVPMWLGAGLEVPPHATAGLLAWLATRVFPYRAPRTAIRNPLERPRIHVG